MCNILLEQFTRWKRVALNTRHVVVMATALHLGIIGRCQQPVYILETLTLFSSGSCAVCLTRLLERRYHST
ncbi:hypothetical protein P389DRAFT_85930 [Cystobasidium minutum MCA 4210]|uniref:uncharacterized protein n=1 Tax=Cystobasidium minutum MCA 4210 TaxID=1397322 RepID=UPI0034CE78C7|eukprot:jgi/Rhomi1/85930/CE85929_6